MDSASTAVADYVGAALSEAPETTRNELGAAYVVQSLRFALQQGHTPDTARNAYLLAVASAKPLRADEGSQDDSAPSRALISLGALSVVLLVALAGVVFLSRMPRAPQMSSFQRDLIDLGAELDALCMKHDAALIQVMNTKPYRYELQRIRGQWTRVKPRGFDGFRLQVNDIRVMTPEDLIFFRNYIVQSTGDASAKMAFEKFFEQVGGIIGRNGPRLRAGPTGLGVGLLLVPSLASDGLADAERTAGVKSWLDQTAILKAEGAKGFMEWYGDSVGFSPRFEVPR
jgi:hypothetical protein